MKTLFEQYMDEAETELLTEGLGPRHREDDPEIKRRYTQFIREGSGNTFHPYGPATFVSGLPPGAYEVGDAANGVFFKRFRANTDDLIHFPDSRMDKVLKEVDRFWSLKPNFTKMGYLHRRGLMLHGPPGGGKSVLIQQVTEKMTERGDTVFHADSIWGLRAALGAFREIEKERPVVVVLEDMDEYVGRQERDVLQLLDGANAFDNTLYIGSTNYINRFPPRLLRPGRFDRKIHIPPPSLAVREVYLKNKLSEVERPEVISQIAQATDGFSFGHLRELVIATYAFQEPLAEVIDRLRDVDHSDLALGESAIPQLSPRRR